MENTTVVTVFNSTDAVKSAIQVLNFTAVKLLETDMGVVVFFLLTLALMVILMLTFVTYCAMHLNRPIMFAMSLVTMVTVLILFFVMSLVTREGKIFLQFDVIKQIEKFSRFSKT